MNLWINEKQGDSFGAGRLYGEAGTCYRKFSSEAAVSSYLKVTCIDIDIDIAILTVIKRYQHVVEIYM